MVVMVPSLFKTQKESFNEEKQLTAFVRHFPKARAYSTPTRKE